jgi:hypothetical protein
MKSLTIQFISFVFLSVVFGCAESEVTIYPNPQMTAMVGTAEFKAIEVIATILPAADGKEAGYSIKGKKEGEFPYILLTVRPTTIGEFNIGTGLPNMPVAVYADSETYQETAIGGSIKIYSIDYRPGGKVMGEFNFHGWVSYYAVNYGKFTAYFPE